MEPLTLALIIVLVLLALNTVAVTVAIVLILLQVKETIRKANTLVDSVKDITDTVITPLTKAAGLVTGIASGVSAAKSVKTFKDIFSKKEKN
jgi:hypothetical protein